MISVLFVCMGNICRSPSAEGVFRTLVDEHNLSDVIHIDSAGTEDYHTGQAPDHRSQEAALSRGIDLSQQRARQVQPTDFETFDYILPMDKTNLRWLMTSCPQRFQNKVKLFLSYSMAADTEEVPDPYYGGEQGFEHVLDLVEMAAEGLLFHIKKHDLAST